MNNDNIKRKRRNSSEVWFERRVERQLQRERTNYLVFAQDAMIPMAQRMEEHDPDRFNYLPISWGKFSDGTDNIKITGFQPNVIAGSDCIFLASFHNNDVTLSAFSVLIVLLQSFVKSLTIVLPYFPVGTMERVIEEGSVATANTYGILLSNLPRAGRPCRLMMYDIHTLQNRFYFHDAVIPSLHSAVPYFIQQILSKTNINAVAFPDEGAAKRFTQAFKEEGGYENIICGKVRNGDKRIVTIHDGDPKDKHVVVVDDLVQTGGTLFECGKALKAAGAASVSAFVTHAVFPNEAYKQWVIGGKKGGVFNKFWITNSIPSTTTKLNTPELKEIFEVVDLLPCILTDLVQYT